VLRVYKGFLRRLAAVLAENERSSIRYYENWPLWAVSEDTHVAQALLHLRGPEAARLRLEAAQRMLANGIEEKMLSIYSDGIAWEKSV
jgi:hypothetical protein